MSIVHKIQSRPILFSESMILAILEGSKKATRRIIKPQPIEFESVTKQDDGWIVGRLRDSENAFRPLKCKFGVVGDLLWIRERHWRDIRDPGVAIFDATPEFGIYQNDPGKVIRSSFPSGSIHPEYPTREKARAAMLPKFWKRKPSIHMPRWACRLVLQITAIRAERVQDANTFDIWAEGCPMPKWIHKSESTAGVTKREWRNLWIKINGQESWDENPWVWVIEFRRVDASVLGR